MFKQYKCERLSSNPENFHLLSDFKANSLGKGLEEYLKQYAWNEDIEGETCFYLIKDIQNEIIAYFSLKCGLLYKPKNYISLDKEEQDFVDLFIDALKNHDTETVSNYYETGKTYFNDENRIRRLYEIALERKDDKMFSIELNEHNSVMVQKCFSAIELKHFCKNINYEYNLDIPLGMGIFWEIIVPLIKHITDLIGCKYLYLFAADNTEIKEQKQQVRKLLQYYRVNLKFEDITDLTIIKPDYDRYCLSLFQSIEQLLKNSEHIWDEFLESNINN